MFDILHVDDEEYILQLYKEELEMAFRGCSIRSAHSGEEALEMLTTYIPDLILLDIRMPGMSGIEVLQRIRIMYPQIPVFLVTAYDTFYAHVSVWNADEYIVKSMDLTELISKITFYCKNKTTPSNLFINSFPFPIAYNLSCIRSKITSKELIDYIFNITEYIIRYFVCIMLSQCSVISHINVTEFLLEYKNTNITMGKWLQMLRRLVKINRDNKQSVIPELLSLLIAKSKDSLFSIFDNIVALRNEIHKRPYSERSSEANFGDIKTAIRIIFDRCIFLRQYTLQIVESAFPNVKEKKITYYIKTLMGSHPEFLVRPINDAAILPYRQVFIRKGNDPRYLNLHPFLAFEFCPNSLRDDVFLFEQFGKTNSYKSSQQGHIIMKEKDFLTTISERMPEVTELKGYYSMFPTSDWTSEMFD